MPAPQATAAASDAAPSVTDPAPLAPSDLPVEGLRLLKRSQRDSCKVCAEEHRERAFEEIDCFYPPGLVIDGLHAAGLVRPMGREAEQELALSASESTGTRIALRFHTKAHHLVGIAEADFTDETLARRFLDLAAGELRARVRLIAYAYGDGATFLYSPSGRSLELQCRLESLVGP